MIDTHCHLLPGLDDGPSSEAEAIRLAAGLAENGVTFVLCTPHYSRRFTTDHAQALEREAALGTELEGRGIGLRTTVAAEVSPERAVSAESEQLLARSIASRFLLVELLPDTSPVSLGTICDRLERLGLLPIFAHPERCRALRRGHEALDEARDRGALVQVVASSLGGRWGDEVAASAWHLVESGRADLLGSDAHHRRHRGALLNAAELVSRHVGDRARWELTENRPRLALAGVHPSEAASAR